MRSRCTMVVLFALAVPAAALGQGQPEMAPDMHEHEHDPAAESPTERHAEHPPPAHEGHPTEHAMHRQSMIGPLGISRTRLGSGTSWLPDSSPMYAIMADAGGWTFMLHGNVFVGYDSFDSRRGADRVISLNSLMGMASHELGPGEIMFRSMLSAEPLTVGKEGYPLILQSGETADGLPLHDRQHPHDLFMELSASYVLPISDDVAVQLYAAPAGEPALGPTAFPHRISALSNPLAPIGHHWQDSTHIAFGVVTVAIFTKEFKLDGSWFNGREPDENRWNLDLRVPDSYSGRFTWNPSESWSLQTSYGYLRSPEALEPDVSVHRITASAAHDLQRGAEGNLATTLAFGQNVPSQGPSTPAVLLESTWSIDRHHDVFGRAEYVGKTGHDLALPLQYENTTYSTGLLSLGYALHLGPFASLSPGLGICGSIGLADAGLDAFYGTQFPLGVMVFAQLRPARMSM